MSIKSFLPCSCCYKLNILAHVLDILFLTKAGFSSCNFPGLWTTLSCQKQTSVILSGSHPVRVVDGHDLLNATCRLGVCITFLDTARYTDTQCLLPTQIFLVPVHRRGKLIPHGYISSTKYWNNVVEWEKKIKRRWWTLGSVLNIFYNNGMKVKDTCTMKAK